MQIIYLLYILGQIFSCHCLTCYQCGSVYDVSQCQTTVQCQGTDRVCFTDIHVQNTVQTFSLGCRAKSQCTLAPSLAIVGRRRVAPRLGCNQCCDTDKCNTKLCQPANNFLLFTDTGKSAIYVMDVATQAYRKIPVTTSNPIAVDYDPVVGNIYWTDVDRKLIKTAALDGSNEIDFYHPGPNSVADGIAVDPVSRLLFYTDTGYDVIALMTLNGRHKKTIIESGLDEPRAIVLDTDKGIMYWTDWGQKPAIESANYDGSNRQKVVTTGLKWPNGIAIDTTAQKLFWIDGGVNKIEVCNTDGTGRQTLYTKTNSHYFGIALLQNTIYFSDWSQSSIRSIQKSGGQNSSSLGPSVFGRINDIHVYKADQSPSGENRCTINQGGCDNICIPDQNSNIKCLCEDGLALQSDQKSCA